MAIPSTGPLNFRELVRELGGSIREGLLAYRRGGAYTPESATQIAKTGPLDFLTFRGLTKTTSGRMLFDRPGTYVFAVPLCSRLTAHVKGGGGGGGLGCWDAGSRVGAGASGSPGQASRYLDIVAQGGAGGQGNPGGSSPQTTRAGMAGAHGTASGGSFNTTGGGGAGGAGGFFNISQTPNSYGGAGGNGAHSGRTDTIGEAGAPTIGQIITLVVGAGGARGMGTPTNDGSDPNFPLRSNGDPGADGSIELSWA